MKDSSLGMVGTHFQFEPAYTVLRLKTGETVLAMLDSEVKDFSFQPTIILHYPVLVMSLRAQVQNGGVSSEDFITKPWLPMSDAESLPISTEVILTMGRMRPAIRQQYIEYLNRTKERAQAEEMENAVLELLFDLNEGRTVQIVDSDFKDRLPAPPPPPEDADGPLPQPRAELLPPPPETDDS